MAWRDLSDEEKKKRLFVINNNLLLNYRQKSNPVSGDSGGSSSPTDEFVEPTLPDENLLLKLNFYQLSSMFQETLLLPGALPTTPVTSNGNTIGFIQDQSRQAIYSRSIGSSSRPTLAANGLVFDNTDDQLTVVGTNAAYLKDLHAVNPVWGSRLKITRNGSEGVAKTIWQTGTGGTTGFGFFMNFTSANRVTVQLCRGQSGVPMVNYVTTRTITVADGECTIHVNINGTGTNACSVRIRNAAGTVTTETFTIIAGIDNNPSQALGIGGALNATLSHDFTIINRVWTTQEMLDYEAATPANTTAHFTPIKQHYYDLSDTSTVFSDAGVTPITDGGIIQRVNNKVVLSYANSPVRRLTGGSDGLLWDSDFQNALGAAIADGSGDRLLTFSQDVLIEAGAVSTLFMICQNTDPDFGSQWMNGGTTYGVFTGKDYSGNSGGTGDAAQPYFLNHPTVSVTSPVLISRSDGPNIIAFRRFGTTIDLWSQNKIKVTTTGLVGACAFILIGQSTANGVPQFHPQGGFMRLEKYAGYLSDAEVEAKIDQYRTQRSIPGNVT